MRITLSANETKSVTIAGGQFYLLSAFSKIAVKVISGGDSREFELSQGMGFKTREGERFFGVEIKDLGGIGQTIEFEISDREVFDNRSVGIVSVVNADKRRTEEGYAFLCARNFHKNTTRYSYVALENPPASGRNIFLNQVVVSTDVAAEASFFVNKDFQVMVDDPSVINFALGGDPVSKRVCADDLMSVAKSYGFHSSIDNGFGGVKRVSRLYLSANQNFVLKLTEPILLCPGSAFIFSTRALDSAISIGYEFFEEPK